MTFNFNTTADQVLADIDLTGKTVIVTGGSSGLGAETARALAKAGADVTITGRSSEKLAVVAANILAETGKAVTQALLELSSPESVRTFTEKWLTSHQTLDLLINNAGVMALPLSRTPEGWEMQFATNHLGPFLLTHLLMPALKLAGHSRVVNLSSVGHWISSVDLDDLQFDTRPYDPFVAYGQSKTAAIWFSMELTRHFAHEGIESFAVHPGGIGETDLGRHFGQEEINQMTEQLFDAENPIAMKSIPQGAATTCWAASSSTLDSKGGAYLEDCQIATPGQSFATGGYAPYAYDVDGAERLWLKSRTLLGL
ncbi:SDR family NAD(P)-dependent oxidoreductase [uncultured Psychromonas sp.]|uniref:SDR family NAD(P)-dependent oxidoreductase n=1 Tax=uncultured Psychromonas sp. TaxID=173974 RepID=UPI002637ED4E|nr:SDR family NAD(P)-dependent oxidoreductase [uncultured Psychromonas sp.]